MKKQIAFLFVLVMMLCLSACVQSKENNSRGMNYSDEGTYFIIRDTGTDNGSESINHMGDAHKNDESNSALLYAGKWKANVLKSNFGNEKTYMISVIQLHEDGAGTYRGRKLDWEYSEEKNIIEFTTTASTGESVESFFEIVEDDGKILLKFHRDIYFKADDFEPMESDAILPEDGL